MGTVCVIFSFVARTHSVKTHGHTVGAFLEKRLCGLHTKLPLLRVAKKTLLRVKSGDPKLTDWTAPRHPPLGYLDGSILLALRPPRALYPGVNPVVGLL